MRYGSNYRTNYFGHGFDVPGSFLHPNERTSILFNIEPVICEFDGAPVFVYSSDANNAPAQEAIAENWNVAVILCGDDEFHLSRGLFFGSSSLDGTVSGFWPILWDFLIMLCVPKMW